MNFNKDSQTLPAVLQLVGDTPMIELHFQPENRRVFAKCEFRNPTGSVKDRLAKHVLVHAHRNGLLKPDSIILECSSGNTGIAMAMVGRVLGYDVTILMSSSASEERRKLIRQLGAELILFESQGRYQTGIDLSRRMAEVNPKYFLPRQFENPLNVEDHLLGTGKEILQQIHGPIHGFVSGYGTGGTLAGCGQAIKAVWPQAIIAAMQPTAVDLLGGECPCCHVIEGVADGFTPPLLESACIDRRLSVSGIQATLMTRRLQREFGLLVGTSSGANMVAALQLALELGEESTVVTLLCDRAERYFSTALFDLPGVEKVASLV